jgi:release factor glutamine methyltransferase
MLTLLEIIKKTTGFLEAKGVENPRLNAELLIGHALGLPRMQLYLQFERMLTEPELDIIRPLVKRRSQREPLQYIVGGVEFFHVKLKVDRRALIPRPETEQLCEVVTKQLAHPPLSILDLGTGSGAIALALAAFYPEAAVTALEVSAEALALARENAAALGLDARIRFLVSDWFTALEPGAQFDLIVANPPYLSEAETAAAAPEVGGHEPRVALSPGPEGTEALARILAEAQRYLGDNGLLALETGIDQHGKLRERAAAAGFGRVDSQRDLSGRDRYLLVWK